MRWLDSERIPYLVGADGWPKVSAVVVDSRLGAIGQKHEPQLRLAQTDALQAWALLLRPSQ